MNKRLNLRKSIKLRRKVKRNVNWLSKIIRGIPLFITSITSIAAVIVAVVALNQTNDLEKIKQQVELDMLLGQIAEILDQDTKDGEDLKLSYQELQKVSWKLSATLKIDPNNVDALLFTSKYFSCKSNYKEAVKYAEKAIKAMPENGYSYFILSEVYYDLEEYNRAIETAHLAISKDFDNSNIHQLLGHSYFKTKEYELSLDHFNYAVSNNPESGHLHFQLGYTYYYVGKLEESRREICKALSLQKDNIQYEDFLKRILYWQGKIRNIAESIPIKDCLYTTSGIKLLTPGTVYNATEDEQTGKTIVIPMWRVPSTGEYMKIGEWKE